MNKKRSVSNIALTLITLASVSIAVISLQINLAFATVTSQSMRPGIKPGDTLVTRQVRVSSISRGDVIVFAHPDNREKKVAHRVVKQRTINGKITIQTKGDANPIKDAWSLRAASSKATKVIAVIPTSKIVNLVPISVTSLLFIASFLLLLLGLWRLIRNRAGI